MPSHEQEERVVLRIFSGILDEKAQSGHQAVPAKPPAFMPRPLLRPRRAKRSVDAGSIGETIGVSLSILYRTEGVKFWGQGRTGKWGWRWHGDCYFWSPKDA